MRRLLLLTGLLAVLLAASALASGGHSHARARHQEQTLAVIGDIPYGDALIAEFPQDVREINADPDVRRVIHLGDIKNGSSRCDTSYFEARLADFQNFDEPLVYTPGDNEWTDCHRASNGGYNPVERLATIRSLFFGKPGRTLARRARVNYQSAAYPENVRWEQAGVEFGVVHVVGSNDSHDPWFTDRPSGPETPAERGQQAREYTGREAAALDWIDQVFNAAERSAAPGVVLGMQADMWDSSAPASELAAFDGIKGVLADRVARFGKPVLLLEGDSHKFLVDTPPGQPTNLTRVVVQGSTTTPHEWLKLHVDPRDPGVFSCENVVFGTGATTPCPAPLAP